MYHPHSWSAAQVKKILQTCTYHLRLIPALQAPKIHDGLNTPDNSHDRHDRRWCTFFKPAYLFPQRTRNGLLLGKFIQRIKTFFVMKIDAPSQILNVTNTTSQCHRHQLRQKIYNVRQTNHQTPSRLTETPGKPKKHQVRQTKQVHQPKHQVCQTKHQVRQTKYQVCEFVFKIDLRCFVVRQFLSRIYAVLSGKFSDLKIC